MSTTYEYDNIGLGLSFQNHSQQIPEYVPHHDRQPTSNPQERPQRPPLSVRSGGFPRDHLQGHQRAHSAVLPQRQFEDVFQNYRSSDQHEQPQQQQYYAPRSAHPLQRPFTSPEHIEYTHSAPVTPISQRGHRESQTYHVPQTEFSRDGRSFRPPIDSRPPPSYGGNYYPAAESSTSGGSGSYLFHNTPQLSSTPFSEAGQFPVSEGQYNHSNFTTPQIMSSPIFETSYRRPNGYFDEEDEMPEEPYIPSIKTNFPPLPSEHRGLNTPDSSPDAALKDKKTVYSRWTASEDELLKEAISKHGDGKWSLVSACVPGRTPMQCSTRWQGALNTSIHKGRWDPDEDAILIKSVSEWQAWHIAEANKEAAKTGQTQDLAALEDELFKNIPWSNIASFLPRPRTGVQALARWSEALDPRITKGKWTTQEDVCLMRGVQKYGKCWIKIANGVRGRTQRQCRTRYCQIATKKRKKSDDVQNISD